MFNINIPRHHPAVHPSWSWINKICFHFGFCCCCCYFCFWYHCFIVIVWFSHTKGPKTHFTISISVEALLWDTIFMHETKSSKLDKRTTTTIIRKQYETKWSAVLLLHFQKKTQLNENIPHTCMIALNVNSTIWLLCSGK